jgi:CubicO group peptidase (beta-lactamase class C family)
VNQSRLHPLPEQEPATPWPLESWPLGQVPHGPALEELLDELFDPQSPMATTYAAVIVHRGRLVAERYGGQLEHFDAPPDPVAAETRLLSWSMAKSVLHAVVGVLVGDGLLDLHAPVDVPQWRDPGDPRSAITLQQLLEMRDGLDFFEDYVDDQRSDVIEMLFGQGQGDVAAFAANRNLAAVPGERFNYSSGTSNIISSLVAAVVGTGDAYRQFLADRLFTPIAVESFDARFDEAGTWIASSYLHLRARDFARFALLYLRDGVFDGRRILPVGWVDHGRRPRSVDVDGSGYGAHWWNTDDPYGTFSASGYAGQRIDICPALDLIVVRLGNTDAAHHPVLDDWRRRVIESFSTASDQAPS